MTPSPASPSIDSSCVRRPTSDFIHPEDRAKVGEAIGRVLHGEEKPMPVEFRIPVMLCDMEGLSLGLRELSSVTGQLVKDSHTQSDYAAATAAGLQPVRQGSMCFVGAC